MRWVALVEGLSFILLLAAMPLKYKMGIPEPVWYLGWAHGYLLMGFIAVIIVTLPVLRWSIWRGLLLFFASLVPFGTIATDFKVKKWWLQQNADSEKSENLETAQGV